VAQPAARGTSKALCPIALCIQSSHFSTLHRIGAAVSSSIHTDTPFEMSHHGHSHGPARPAPSPSAGPIATPPDQKEVLRLCNKLMGDKKFRQVEGLLGDRRVQTFRGA